MIITRDQLISIIGVHSKWIVDRILGYLNETLVFCQINTPLRICHFLAQVLHESGGFKYFEEIASGSAYEGRIDLGNTSPGDGKKYKGRGVIQLSGRYNYMKISKDLGVDFINHPELLANDKYGVQSAGWYWNLKKLNELADKDDIIAITKKVNGGLNGIDSRKAWLTKCKQYINEND
jgi:putative chitinase